MNGYSRKVEEKSTKIIFEEGILKVLLCDKDYYNAKDVGSAILGRYDGENKIILVNDSTMDSSQIHVADINYVSQDIKLRIPTEPFLISYNFFEFKSELNQLNHINGKNSGLIERIELYMFGKEERNLVIR